jgi:hypothetical protein
LRVHHRGGPPALLGLLTGGPKLMVITVVVCCVLNFIVQSIIQPRFIGDAGCRSTAWLASFTNTFHSPGLSAPGARSPQQRSGFL